MVWVSPGMFDTKVMVAPNSPIALAKPSTMPASTPGSASGSVMVRNTRQGAAPSVSAACSSLRSTASIDSLIGRTSNGNDIAPRQQPRDANSERRCDQRRNRGHPKRELNRRPFGWRDIEHDRQVVGLTRNLKPYFSKMALADDERRNARYSAASAFAVVVAATG